MDLFIVNSPAELPWQTNLYDLLIFAIVVTVVVNAVVHYRRGTRMWLFVLIASLVYGIVLELAGMATLNMYLQGDFLVMLNFPAIPLFAGTTAMPLYVTFFYPVIFAIGFKIVESLGIESRWKAAVAGGLFMVCLDAAYIIEGNLRHVVWWTWDPKFTMFEYWLGWPLIDMGWQALWGATFFYLMLRCKPHVDGSAAQRWSNAEAFALRAPAAAVSVLVIGTVLLFPLVVTTLIGIPQWPVLALLVAAMTIVTVRALRTSHPPYGRVDPVLASWVAMYALAFSAMIVGNVIHERGITLYLTVQTLGVIGVLAFTTYPLRARRRVPQTPARAASSTA